MYDKDDCWTLARTIFGEARGETYDGKLAVGHVIMNRWRSGFHREATCLAEVAQWPYQFSCWTKGDPNRPKLYHANLEDRTFRECFRAALEVLDGAHQDNTQGSRHYFAANIKERPRWAKGKTHVAHIGGHLFFNDID